jgi:hypothetical protein
VCSRRRRGVERGASSEPLPARWLPATPPKHPLNDPQPTPTLQSSPSPQSHTAEVEYKYVVRNPDGEAAAWKPGSNYRLSLASLAPVLVGAARRVIGGVSVRDAWDGAVRDVSVEVAAAEGRRVSEAEREHSATVRVAAPGAFRGARAGGCGGGPALRIEVWRGAPLTLAASLPADGGLTRKSSRPAGSSAFPPHFPSQLAVALDELAACIVQAEAVNERHIGERPPRPPHAAPHASCTAAAKRAGSPNCPPASPPSAASLPPPPPPCLSLPSTPLNPVSWSIIINQTRPRLRCSHPTGCSLLPPARW